MNKIKIPIPLLKTTFFLCMDCTVGEACEAIGVENDLPESYQGFVIKKDGCGPFIYINDSKNIPLVVHELYHAVHRQLSAMHIEDEETIAYTLEYLLKEFLKKHST